MNNLKSEIKFSKNMPRRLAKMMGKALKCKIVDGFTKYLGCYVDEAVGSKTQVTQFTHIKTTLENRLQSWRSRFLSQAGRITLIKLTLQSLPIHQLSFHKLTKQEVQDCDRIIRNFFWGNDRDANKIHMMIWD